MQPVCLLGIDPGSRLTGFGIVRDDDRYIQYVSSGCIRMSATAMPARLQEIFNNISQLIQRHQPSILAIEKVFMHKNADAALKLGQARGVAIVAAMQQGLQVFEYTPNEIKQAVVGHGHADKTQVQYMIQRLLHLSAVPQADAADALAVALCHVQTQKFYRYLA